MELESIFFVGCIRLLIDASFKIFPSIELPKMNIVIQYKTIRVNNLLRCYFYIESLSLSYESLPHRLGVFSIVE